LGKTLISISALLASIALLLTGNSLQGTLLSLRAAREGFPTEVTGVVMAAYFAGFVAGSWFGPRLILAVGHVRVFAGLASVSSGVVLAHVLLISPVTWGLMRIVTGFCFAGLYMVMESWLNDRADNTNRGQVLSLYQVTNFGAVALGPLLLNLGDPRSFELFLLISILISFSLVPITMIPSPPPRAPEMSGMSFMRLVEISPLGVAGAAMTGLAFGAFWAMGPVFGADIGLDAAGVSLLMSVGTVGSLAMQYPLGLLSDRVDRRFVIAGTSLAGAGAAIIVALVSGTSLWSLIVTIAVFGALSLPIYSLCMAHANDFAQPRDLIRLSSGLLLANGLGATAGPILAATIMGMLGPGGLFFYMAAVLVILAGYAIWRVSRRAAPAPQERTHFAIVPPAGASSDLDRRVVESQSQDAGPEA
jgi:MFS family permease